MARKPGRSRLPALIEGRLAGKPQDRRIELSRERVPDARFHHAGGNLRPMGKRKTRSLLARMRKAEKLH